jgi:hypothetical protein
MIVVMENSKYGEIVDLIKNKNMDLALKILFSKLSNECLRLIRSKRKNITHYEAIGIFYYAFLDLCERINSDKFIFQNDSAFITYFKTACVHQVFAFIRETSSPVILLPREVYELLHEEGKEKIQQSKNDFIGEKKNLYDIEIQFTEEETFDYLGEVIRSFHLLGEKCKILILLKYFVQQTHEQISDILRLFYDVHNANVAKTQLSRCIRDMRKMVISRNN